MVTNAPGRSGHVRIRRRFRVLVCHGDAVVILLDAGNSGVEFCCQSATPSSANARPIASMPPTGWNIVDWICTAKNFAGIAKAAIAGFPID